MNLLFFVKMYGRESSLLDCHSNWNWNWLSPWRFDLEVAGVCFLDSLPVAVADADAKIGLRRRGLGLRDAANMHYIYSVLI